MVGSLLLKGGRYKRTEFKSDCLRNAGPRAHGRHQRDFSYENLADDVAALLDYLKIPSADLIGYSKGGGVAMQCAIRHPEKVRKVVSISAVFRHDGWVKEALDAFPQLTAETFKGSPIETEYKRLSLTPN